MSQNDALRWKWLVLSMTPSKWAALDVSSLCAEVTYEFTTWTTCRAHFLSFKFSPDQYIHVEAVSIDIGYKRVGFTPPLFHLIWRLPSICALCLCTFLSTWSMAIGTNTKDWSDNMSSKINRPVFPGGMGHWLSVKGHVSTKCLCVEQLPMGAPFLTTSVPTEVAKL